MGLEALWTTPLGLFYITVSTIIFVVFSQKFAEKYSFLFTFTTIMIAREWWETPIFIFAYLGWFGHSVMGFLSQLFTFALFLIVIVYFNIEVRKIWLPLLTSFLANFVLLFYFHLYIVGYVARVIGFAAITITMMNAKIGKDK